TQVIATVLSHDRENDPDTISILGASVALTLSDIPFAGPIAAVRVGRIGGKLVVNPTGSQVPESDLNLIVAGSRDALVMVEGGMQILPEATVLEALFGAHAAMQPLIALQDELRKRCGKPKRVVTPPAVDEALAASVKSFAEPKLRAALAKTVKQERYAALDAAHDETIAALGEGNADKAKQVGALVGKVTKHVVRQQIIGQRTRLDGRGLADIRPISVEVDVLPRTHGSAIFTRGETQALVATTLGTSADEQKIDALTGEYYKTFMLHYNFPPYSTGEPKFLPA